MTIYCITNLLHIGKSSTDMLPKKKGGGGGGAIQHELNKPNTIAIKIVS